MRRTESILTELRYARKTIEFRHTNAQLDVNETGCSEAERKRTPDARRNVFECINISIFGYSISPNELKNWIH